MGYVVSALRATRGNERWALIFFDPANERKQSQKEPRKPTSARVSTEPRAKASDLLSSENVGRTVQAVRLSHAAVKRPKPEET